MIDKSIVLMGERYVIRWMRYKNAFPAFEYVRGLADADRIEARLRVLATMMAEEGRLPSEIHGHWLQPPFEEIFEFKPFGHRILGFEEGSNFYLTNGAPKRKKKAQEGDYQVAANMRRNLMARLKPRMNGGKR